MSKIFSPGPTPNAGRAVGGHALSVPEVWSLVLLGDAALTRRVKAAGNHWFVA